MPLQRGIAVVGSGCWGTNLIRIFAELGALHTICTRRKTNLHSFYERYKGVTMAESIDEVVPCTHIFAVCIATPSHTHFEIAKKALQAGKDVLVEKPMCLSEKDAEELVNLSERHERILMVGHQLMYHPAVVRLQKMIAQDELGRLIYISSSRLNFGTFRHEENVLWSFAPHDVSMILGLVKENPISIMANAASNFHSKNSDIATLLLDFPSGTKARICVSRLHPFKEQRLVVTGQELMVIFDDMAPWHKKLTRYSNSICWNNTIPTGVKPDATPIVIEPYEPLKAECEHFLRCVKTRIKPLTDAEEGLRVVRVIEQCKKLLER
jgi:UDP-2-acetamido-3-amino-2,3-dideoxy-glucuronate N-acetyltransferase